MIRIVNYKLRHYRNIKLADLNFENYNVIIGTNNSGKSNFIQSFSFLNFLVNGAVEEVSAAFRTEFRGTLYKNVLPSNYYITEDPETIPAISAEIEYENTETNRKFTYAIRLRFRSEDNSRFLKFYIDQESLYYKVYSKPGSPVKIFSRTENNTSYGADFPKIKFDNGAPDTFSLLRVLQIVGGANEAYADAQQCLSLVLKTPVFYFSHTELTKNDGKDQLSLYNGRIVAFDLEEEILRMEGSDHWDIFKSSVFNVLGIEGVEVMRFRLTDKKSGKDVIKSLRFKHAKSFKSLGQLSDGSILLIALIVKVLNSENDIFFIEEPENSIHPKALVDLVNFLQSFSENKQFIITSHSIVLLNKSKLGQIITSRLGDDGMSEFANVSSRKDLKARLRSGLSNFADELFFEQKEEEFD